MDLQIALKKTNGKWDVGMHTLITPGQKAGYYTCQATGKYLIWARPTSMSKDIKFPTEKELNGTK